VLVPETAGDLQIPALPFAYFDPSSGRIVRVETAPLSLHVEAAGGTGSAGASVPAAVARARGTPLVLRSDLDLPGRPLLGLGTHGVLLILGLVGAAHGLILAAADFGRRKTRVAGRVASRPSLRAALSEVERAQRGGLSKEAAAALIEKALHDVFGSLDGVDSGGAREAAARAVLDDVHFLRYAPQLGDYSEKIREVGSRAADVMRRWA
jgi:hypothetical protein